MQPPTVHPMSALGDAFRAAREAQGLTLSDVAQRIHIRTAYLAAIEAEDWKSIGPPVYIRGFLRTYARCLGLNGDAAVAHFSGDAAAKTPPVAFPTAPRGEPAGNVRGPIAGRSASETPKRGLSTGAIVGLAVALVLVLYAAFQFFDYRLGEPVAVNGVRSGPPANLSAAPSAQPAASAAASQVAGGASAQARDVRARPVEERTSGFAIRLADSSWLRVVVDGKVAMEGVYPKGTTRTFAGRSATVRTGNAGGVDLSVAGKDLGPMGGLGDVAERSFQL